MKLTIIAKIRETCTRFLQPTPRLGGNKEQFHSLESCLLVGEARVKRTDEGLDEGGA